MGNRILGLYASDEDILLAKTKGINLSAFFREALKIELAFKDLADTTTKEELISKLKNKIAIMAQEMELQRKKIEILEKEAKEKAEKEKNRPKKWEYVPPNQR